LSSIKDEMTGFFDSVESVRGVINSFAAGVMITLTEAPDLINKRTRDADLYAAIPAVIPNRIFLPRKIDIFYTS